METPQQEGQPSLIDRLNSERIELAAKIEKLKTFVTINPVYQELEWGQQRLLNKQLKAMAEYEEALIERMILLNQKEENEND